MWRGLRRGGLRPGRLSWVPLSLLFCIGLLLASQNPNSADVPSDLPRTMLWAWERPEDLNYLDARSCGVAFFIRRYRLSGDEIIRVERAQILRAPHTAKRIAVVRIEPLGSKPPSLSEKQRKQLVKEIAMFAKLPNICGIQIDFDARITERDFYRALLKDLRVTLPANYFISMTALASWCISDNWVNDLPVDEVVAMLFDMGADAQRIRGMIKDKKNCFTVPPHKLSLGLSTKEPDIFNMFKNEGSATLKNCQRVYIFSPKSWTRESYSGAVSGVSF